MTSAEGPHILVVDDDTRLRTLLQKFLAESGYRVTGAANARDAETKLHSFTFDLLVVDVMMPGESGLDFTARIRQTSDVPILLLTARGDPEHRIDGLERGADDYLPKPFEPRELILRIAAILRRVEESVALAVLKFGDYEFSVEKGELAREGAVVPITSSEAQLLRIFAESPRITLSRAELAERMGGVGERTVDVQVTRLRRRIEADPRNPRYLKTVWGEGYALWAD